ncbi:ATP-binding protein [Geoalkalibacter subterraneus]|uniref:ATP-binding protein n=1 Tax=Geoalkalibacter subterraneus TaxID=483547 RepID=A0A0B5FJC5_9BACT|nr:ATP-binding protein [Geoalkalibacter subterraneus]AJF08272.1 hypothetical protein GSUB_17500 [Geoalkalibacter subterraneus]
MSEISLKINQSRLMSNLRYAFSNKFKVIGELAQNARRAGASYVSFRYFEEQKVLQVKDDGCGVGDFQNLLSVAESGWDENIQRQDTPFGMGFLAALFCCPTVTVKSGGLRSNLVTEDVLAGESVVVEPCIHAPRVGTEVDLEGFDVDSKELSKQIGAYAKGFPIPVFFNGEEIARPCALDGGRTFEKTPIGYVSLVGLHAGVKGDLSSSRRIFYLQGVKVLDERGYYSGSDRADIVHLDPRRFFARIPDRDSLIDPEGAACQVRDALAEVWKKHLEEEFARLSPEEFANTYLRAVEQYAVKMLNDLPFIPASYLEVAESYPLIFQEWEDGTRVLSKPVYREQVESGQVCLASIMNDICLEGEGAFEWMYLFDTKMPVLRRSLPEGHWANKYLVNLDQKEWELEINNEQGEQNFWGKWVYGKIILCESFTLKAPGLEPVTFTAHAMVCAEGFVVPAGEKTGQVVRQACNYRDECDLFCEDDADSDYDKFSAMVANLRNSDPAQMLKSVLDGVARIGDFPALEGKKLLVTISEKGEACIELAA